MLWVVWVTFWNLKKSSSNTVVYALFSTKDQIKWWEKITNKAGSLVKINFQLL